MNRNELLKSIKLKLHDEYNDRLEGVVLYGSVARGDMNDDSDIDILVLLKGPIDYGKDLETNISVLYSLSLELGRRISAKPVDSLEYNNIKCPLYEITRKEGIAV